MPTNGWLIRLARTSGGHCAAHG